jgi:anaerobic magnesium-protoporphyrin IX monomethyl ester cyclase
MEKKKEGKVVKKILLSAAKMDFARFIPLGIAYLAAYCEREGYNVCVYDELPDRDNSLTDTLKSFKPDMIGISCMTVTYQKACQYAREAKAILPSTPIVFGGVHPTVAIEDTLKNDDVDFVVHGEGEETLVELLRRYGNDNDYSGITGLAFKKNGKISINRRRSLISDLDSLPMPARHLFPMDYYAQRWNWPRGYWYKTANVMSSRGCPYDCTFCASKTVFGRSFRGFSPERTVDEIERLVKIYGFECISFSDDTFAINKKRAIEICKQIKERKIKAAFRIQLRADTCDEDLISELKNAGCIHIDIGAESGSDRILKAMRKGITAKQIRDAIEMIKKYKIHTGLTFIIGSSQETEEDLEATRDLANELRADYTQFFIMTPYPGTDLYNYAKEHKLIPDNITYDYFCHAGENLKPFLNSFASPDRLVKLRDELNGSFANKIAKNYFKRPKFIQDLVRTFAENPYLFFKFAREYLRTFNFGSALKLVLPHKL